MLKLFHSLDSLSSAVLYLGCMVVNINVLFAEWRIPERDYFQILLFGILIEPTIYFQI